MPGADGTSLQWSRRRTRRRITPMVSGLAKIGIGRAIARRSHQSRKAGMPPHASRWPCVRSTRSILSTRDPWVAKSRVTSMRTHASARSQTELS